MINDELVDFSEGEHLSGRALNRHCRQRDVAVRWLCIAVAIPQRSWHDEFGLRIKYNNNTIPYTYAYKKRENIDLIKNMLESVAK